MKKLAYTAVALCCLAGIAQAFNFDFGFGVGKKNAVQWVDLLPSLSWSPSSKAFGNQSTNVAHSQLFTLSNNGNDTAEEVVISATGTSFRYYSSTCGTQPFNLASGANCTTKVEFKPATAASFTGYLNYSAPNIAKTAATLTGTGVTPPAEYTLYASNSTYSSSTDHAKSSGFLYSGILVATGTHTLKKITFDFHTITGDVSGKTWTAKVISRTGSALNLSTGIKATSNSLTGITTTGLKEFVFSTPASVVAGDTIVLTVAAADVTNYVSLGKSGTNTDSGYGNFVQYSSTGVENTNAATDLVYYAYE